MSAPQLGPTPAQITMMGHNISARIVAAKLRRRRRRRVAVVATGLAASVAVTAAGIGVVVAPPDIQARAYTCYTADRLDSIFHVMPYPDDLPEPAPAEQITLALENCEGVYEQRHIDAPHPTVCRLPDLRLGVFPNLAGLEPDAFCLSLGLGGPE